MNRRLPVLAFVLVLGACGAPQPTCPWLGIDVNNPDYYARIAPQTVEAVYNCELGRTRDLYAQTDLKFQWNLWRRVLNREISPGAAQQQWLQFSNDHAYQQGQLDAAQRGGSHERGSPDLIDVLISSGHDHDRGKDRGNHLVSDRGHDDGHRSGGGNSHGGPAVPDLSGVAQFPVPGNSPVIVAPPDAMPAPQTVAENTPAEPETAPVPVSEPPPAPEPAPRPEPAPQPQPEPEPAEPAL